MEDFENGLKISESESVSLSGVGGGTAFFPPSKKTSCAWKPLCFALGAAVYDGEVGKSRIEAFREGVVVEEDWRYVEIVGLIRVDEAVERVSRSLAAEFP